MVDKIYLLDSGTLGEKNNFSFDNAISKLAIHYNNKQNILIFLLLFLGALLPTLSDSDSFNFWYKLLNILRDPTFNMLLFAAIGINIVYITKDLMTSYDFIIRYQNMNDILKVFKKDLIISTIYLIIVMLIMSVASNILFSFGNFKMIMYSDYNIPIIFYIIFYVIRAIFIVNIISMITFFIMLISNRTIVILITLLSGTLFYLLPMPSLIEHFYNMKILYHYYFTSLVYNSFLLEVIISIIEIMMLTIIEKILYRYVLKKKRDLL